MKKILLIILCLNFILPGASYALPETSESIAEYHQKRGDLYLKEERNFQAIEEYRQAIKHGAGHPALFRKMAKVLYLMGLIDEAVVEMEKAVELLPGIDVFRIELGVLYLAGSRLEKAKKQFYAALEINPGFTNVYYYLGELFFREGDFDMAWLSAKMANRLGHRGKGLLSKLSEISEEPDAVPWDESGKELYIRQIIVDTRMKAEYIVEKIKGGDLFEALASDISMGPYAHIGGYMGHFDPSEIHPGITGALLEREAIADPVIVEMDKGFHIVQRLVPFNAEKWKKMLADSTGPQKAGTKNEQPVVQADKKTFIVYAGSFRDKENAVKRVRELRKNGYPSFRFMNKSKSEETLHNVVAGQFSSLHEAKEVKEKISRQGYGSFIVEY